MGTKKSEISAAEFCKSLCDNGDLSSCLSKFIIVAENFNSKTSNYDIIKDYMRISGDCKEILQLIKRMEDHDSQIVMLIMQTLCHILIHVATDLQAFMPVGTSVVKEILENGMKTIFNFLKIKQKSSRTKLALHLLSCMVAVGEQTAHQVVSKLDFSTVTFNHLLNRQNFSEEEDIRTTFINLIILILTTCNKTVIHKLVEIKGFLNDVIPGLVSDRPDVIILVLSTFKKMIVEDISISKTIKLHLFNDYSLRPVIKLYTWVGPIRQKTNRKRKLGEEEESVAYEASEEEINNVHVAAHEFMLALCTSYKTGIIFQDLSYGSSGKNNNNVLTVILNCMPKPHTNKLAADFVISVLKACPDQITFYLPTLKGSFIPRLSPRWLEVVSIIKKIFAVQDIVSCLFRHQEKKSVSTLINIAKSLTLPNLLISSEISDAFKDRKYVICYYLSDLFICIFEKVKKIAEYCLQADFSKTPYSASEVSTFRSSFLTTVIQNFGFMKDLEIFWENLTSESEVPKETENIDIPIPSLSSQLYRLLELMQHFLHISRLGYHDYDINVPKLYQNLKNCHALLSREDICNVNLKLVDIISAQGEEVIMLWNQNISDSPLMVLLDVYMTTPSANVIDDILQILSKVLVYTKIFEYCIWEMNIWLQSMKFSKAKHFAIIIEFINSAVCTLLENPNMFSDDIIENALEKASSSMSLNVSHILNDLLSKEGDPIITEVYEDSTTTASPKLCFSSFVPAALLTLNSIDESNRKVCQTFLEKALCNIMHHQQSPEVLFSVIQNYKKNISADLFNYFKLLGPGKYEEKMLVDEGVSVVCKTDISDHLKMKFLTSHVLPSSCSGCFCDIQCNPNQLDLSYKEKLIWQIMTYLDWEISLLMENKIKNSNVEVYLNLLENLLVSLDMAVINDEAMELCDIESEEKTKAMEICNSESEEKKIIYGILEDVFSRPVLLTLFLFTEKVPKCHKTSLRQFVNIATKLVLNFINRVIVFEECRKYLSGFKNKILKYNSIYFQTRNWPKGAVMCEHADIHEIITKFSVLFSNRELTNMLEDALNMESEDIKLENHFTVLSLLLKMCVDTEDFAPLSPKAINSFVMKYANLAKKQKKKITDFAMKIFKKHPDLTSVISPDTCQYLLKQAGNKNFYILGTLVDNNKDLRKIIEAAVLENIEEFKNTSDILFLIPKCILVSNLDDEKDKEFLEAISSLYWETVSSYILTDISSPDSLLENSDTGKALQILFKQEILATRKLSKFFKNNKDSLYADVPHLSKLSIFLDLMEILKSFTLERNKSPLPLIKLTIHWFKNSVSSIHSTPEFKYFPLLKFTVNLLKDIPEIALDELVETDTFFPKILKVSFKHRNIGIYLLEILTILCEKSKNFNVPAQMIFNLVTGHSNFFKIMLSEITEDESIKECIIDLLIVLVNIDKSVCKDNHLGLILSSYKGTLKSIDQKLLFLIKIYSESDIDIDRFRPFLWSQTAVVQYSVMNSESRHLGKKPKMQDLLSIFSSDVIENTVLKYPLTLKLEPLVVDPNELENCTEADRIYDLRFFLPLFADVLSPGSFVHCNSFFSSKVLMLIFTSLSSFDDNTRSLGYYCLAQLYFHLEGTHYSYKEKDIWLSFLDSLRNSITTENSRIPSIVSLFLARVSDIFTNPGHSLYSVLYKFIMVKPNLDISQVPEFYKLFNSIEIGHRIQRMWLLQLLADGLRTSVDFHICGKRYIFSILLTHFWSSVSTNSEKVTILNIISAAVRIDSSARQLCQNSLLTWLHCIIKELDLSDFTIVRPLCSVMTNLWLTTKKFCGLKEAKENPNSTSENIDTKTKVLYTSFPTEFQLVVLSLCEKLNLNISSEDHQNLLQISQSSTVEIKNIDAYINKLSKLL